MSSVVELKKQDPKVWVEPVFTPHNIGSMNKFGRGGDVAKDYIDNIDGVAVKALVEKYGSPLFVTSEEKLRGNIRSLKNAFANRYPNVIHGWSYKTNYTSAICNVMHQEGSWAEVVSEFEYEKARHLGVPGDKIIFNGPHKSPRILERAIKEGAKIHVDHYEELQCIESIGRDLNRTVPVTLRLNFDTGYSETWSRFGFNLENGEAINAAHFINHSSNLKLTGLHSHIGTFILEPRAYSAQVEIMCGFMARVESETESHIEYLDIGGGFASRNALQGVYLPPEQVVPSLDQYAEAITKTLLKAVGKRAARGLPVPTLVLESGRAMVDDAQVLLTSVAARKRLPDGRKAIIVDAGVNLLFTGFWYHHPLKLTQEISGLREETVIYGPLCMNIDIVRQSVQLPPLNTGDILHISPVGAYNNTQWLQFIEYRPAVVMVHSPVPGSGVSPEAGEEPEVSVIREAENLEVMNAQDRLPSHLLTPFETSQLSVPNANRA